MDASQLIALIREGESERVEFKERPSQELAKEVCAMANAKGGYTLIGVDDNGNIVGVGEKALERVSQALQSVEGPLSYSVEKVNVGEKVVIVVKVKELHKGLCTVGGVAYIRVGTSKKPISIEDLLTIAAEKSMLDYDLTVTPATEEEFSPQLVEAFMAKRKLRGYREGPWEEVKRALGAVKEGYATLAGLLFFHPQPQRYYPHTYVRYIKGEEWKRIGGPIPQQVEELLNLLREEIKVVTLARGIERKDYPTYSERALREALVNALIHRNYAVKAEVFVTVERDRIEIKNPGSFPPGTSLDEILPSPRNPHIYEIAFQWGLVERMGSGIKLMLREAEENPLFDVDIRPSKSSTTVVFRRTFAELGEKEKAVLELLAHRERSTGEVAQRLSVSPPTARKILERLKALGLVEERGYGRSQRWRLVI